LEMCLRVNALALVLNENFRKLGCLELWWLGGIYSPQPPKKPLERLLSMGAPDNPVCCHVTQPLGFGAKSTVGALSSCGTGQSMPHRTGPVYCPVRLRLCGSDSARTVLHCSSVSGLCSRPLHELPVAPLAHRIVWWFTRQSGEL
jgi:hypothetical protein